MTIRTRRFPPVASLALCSLLIGGCASEQALLTETQPLRERIDSVERQIATSNAAGLRDAEARTAHLAARQSVLEKQLAEVEVELAGLRNRIKVSESALGSALQRLDARDTALETRAGSQERQLAETLALARANAQKYDELRANRQQETAQVAALAENMAASTAEKIARKLTDIDRRIDELNRLNQATAQALANQAAALQARQDTAERAANSARDATNQRLRQAEDKLATVSGLVQEALALAAKEIFLANGREAFSVTLTEDKVLYPQNDPNLERKDAAKLDDLSLRLNQLDQEYHLDIQGHTANNSTEDNNYNLGKARAEVVKRYLHEQRGISLNRMSTLSYGANKPLDAGNGNNRRIHIRVLVLK
jgi:outer membrane protein OmpA-like peptidoglycan-associated protein